MCRYINHVKGQINEQAAAIKVVGSADQPANSISKEIKSPTTHLRETVRVQGSQQALDRLLATAKQTAAQRKSQRRGKSKLGASDDDSATDENTHKRLEEDACNMNGVISVT
jgi:phosphate starvation-inducible protein PhoH